ncbi:sporulation membrane protein YtaF [Brevibacillus sp. SYP-B805]|uniref:sporulation membrane protein YtaF n=1 Tax=Brevibacillus sp. SYP-B805 TaxID=1578199 RepID=UPI0013ED540C|nr:sporulation membrane protein YtaF [Brevibacillus sp. SYP-B805]NGQ95977.1 sporulation membrane protein YtaF [Brevibacillus sp. SYP-B805]
MSDLLALFLVSIAISLDGFGVGMTYGLRKLRMPFHSLVVIGCCSFAVVYVVMTVGGSLTGWISPDAGKWLGSSILILIGIFTLWRLWKQPDSGEGPRASSVDGNQPITQIHLFGHIIQILKDPARADADKSGHIAGWEAVMLGFALSLDAFGAGLSLTLFGFSPLLVSGSVAITSALLLFGGSVVGSRLEKFRWVTRLSWLPPVLLICIGLARVVI